MSRGPGKIERAIRALFDSNPDRAFTTYELVEHCYPERGQTPDCLMIDKKHTVAVLRAAHKVCARDPNWEAWAISYGSRHAGVCFVNMDSIESFKRGGFLYQERRLWRIDWTGDRARWRTGSPDDAEMREYLERHGEDYAPGSSGWRAVEMHRAARDGDTERFEQLQAEDEAEQAARTARFQEFVQRISGREAHNDDNGISDPAGSCPGDQ